jgi:hypothetical protein
LLTSTPSTSKLQSGTSSGTALLQLLLNSHGVFYPGTAWAPLLLLLLPMRPPPPPPLPWTHTSQPTLTASTNML